MTRSPKRCAALALTAVLWTSFFTDPAAAARHDPPERETVHGSTMITLLDWGDIPSIDDPTLVAVAEADSFMEGDEMVIGITDPDGRNPRCYSLVHLDHHEVVNDRVGDAHVSVTW